MDDSSSSCPGNLIDLSSGSSWPDEHEFFDFSAFDNPFPLEIEQATRDYNFHVTSPYAEGFTLSGQYPILFAAT